MIKNTLNHWIRSFFLITLYYRPPKVGQINLILIWQAPTVFFQKWCLSLLSIVVIKLQVRVLRLMKMHDDLNVPPCIIWTPRIIWFRNGYSRIFRLWAFRKYKLLFVSNVHNKEYAPLKQNICIFLYISVWNIFSDLYVTCGLIFKLYTTAIWKHKRIKEKNFNSPRHCQFLPLEKSRSSYLTF